jgi:hypothetical protein
MELFITEFSVRGKDNVREWDQHLDTSLMFALLTNSRLDGKTVHEQTL